MSGKVKKWFSADKIIVALVVLTVGVGTFCFVRDLEFYDYIVETNAFFAPFEFYENVEFDVRIDNVAEGVIADAGAAGLTITPAREKKVDFTIPYYTSVQYVIFRKDEAPELREWYVVWEALSGRTLGSQTGSTGYMFVSDEINDGVLVGTGTKMKGFDSHQLAADAISAHIIDYAIADELAAQFIVEKNPELMAVPLYYSGEEGEADYPVEESYAIAVNKERPELLAAFNEVLTEMTARDPKGISQMDRLIIKYMELTNE